jgi:L,D-transpeptidase catalytic domain
MSRFEALNSYLLTGWIAFCRKPMLLEVSRMNRNSTSKPARNLAVAVLLSLTMSGLHDPAGAESRRKQPEAPVIQGALSGPPVMAVVSIKDQRISLYDRSGGFMRARISSGRPDYETPVGIYSVLQKQKDHYSNVYDDASMPFMQRITWSGVSLHEGELPGYPASHGCVRMPRSFAEQIFPLTKIGMRVVVARDDVAPIDIAHPNLLKPGPLATSAAATQVAIESTGSLPEINSVFQADVRNWPQRQAELDALKAIAAEKAAAAELTKAPAEELKRIATEKTAERDKVAKLVRAAEKVTKAAGEKLARADRELTAAKDPARLKKWENAKTKADAAVVAAGAKLTAATANLQSITDVRQRAKAEKALKAVEKMKKATEEKAVRAERDLADAKSPSKYKRQEDQKAKAEAAAALAEAKLAAVKTQMQAAEDAFQQAKNDSDTAEAAMTAAVDAAKEAQRKTFPVSIFVSLKTQRLYIRQGYEPIVDVPIAIADPTKPIGTHVYTAVGYVNGGSDLQWNAVSLARRTSADFAELNDRTSRNNDSWIEPHQTNARLATAALDRVTMPPEILERFSASVWTGSSLIVSDEALSKETGNATDFVVLISGEPQGGIKRRPKPAPVPVYNRYNPYYGPNYNPYYSQGYRPNRYMRYDRYGRPIRVQPKPVFNWW